MHRIWNIYLLSTFYFILFYFFSEEEILCPRMVDIFLCYTVRFHFSEKRASEETSEARYKLKSFRVLFVLMMLGCTRSPKF